MTESTVKPTAVSLNAADLIRKGGGTLLSKQPFGVESVATTWTAEIIDRICVLPLLEALEKVQFELCYINEEELTHAEKKIKAHANAAIEAARSGQ